MTCPYCQKSLPDSKNTRKRHIPKCERATSGVDETPAQIGKSPSERKCPWCGKWSRSDNLNRHMRKCKSRPQEQPDPLAQEGLVINTPVEQPATDEQSSSASGRSPASLSSSSMSLNEREPDVLLSTQELHQELPDSASSSLERRLDQADAPLVAATPSQNQDVAQQEVKPENWWGSEESIRLAISLGLLFPVCGISHEESDLI